MLDRSVELISKLKDLHSDVALEWIAHYPEYVKHCETMMAYKKECDKNNQQNANQSFMIYQEILNDISYCLRQEGLTFDEKLTLINKEIEVAKLADELIIELD